MDLYNWRNIPEEQLSPSLVRQTIHTPQMTIARLRLAKGAIVPVHHHVNEQITMLQSGVLRFVVGGEEVIVGAGDALRIPPHAPHSVETLEEAIAIDLFTPPREDWIRGDDAYLRA